MNKSFGFYNLPAQTDGPRARLVFMLRRLLRRLMRRTFYAMEARFHATYLRIETLREQQARLEGDLINIQALGRRLEVLERHLAEARRSAGSIGLALTSTTRDRA